MSEFSGRLADLAEASTPPPVTPKGWNAQMDIGTEGGYIVTRADSNRTELSTEDQIRVMQEHGLNPEEWTVTSYRRSEWDSFRGDKLTAHRINVVPRKGQNTLSLPDLDDLHQAVKSVRRAKHWVKSSAGIPDIPKTVVAVLADLQVGKVDSRGGTQELLDRLEASRERFSAYAERIGASEAILIDAGDSTEGFENTAAQARTNDLGQTEQIRVWRRTLWTWTEELSRNHDRVRVVTVPSNHCAVRRGKDYLSDPIDDWGVEVLAQVEDIAKANPALYSHVSFHAPSRYEESLVLDVHGKGLGVVHGHQYRNNGFEAWLAGQANGRMPIGYADFIVTGHYHSFKWEPVGGQKWWLQAPTADNGSSWWRNLKGISSPPNIAAFTLDETGFGDLALL